MYSPLKKTPERRKLAISLLIFELLPSAHPLVVAGALTNSHDYSVGSRGKKRGGMGRVKSPYQMFRHHSTRLGYCYEIPADQVVQNGMVVGKIPKRQVLLHRTNLGARLAQAKWSEQGRACSIKGCSQSCQSQQKIAGWPRLSTKP